MKFTIERTQFEREKNYWKVAFTIEDETGVQMYTPTTIFDYELPVNPTEADIMAMVAKKVLPGQIAQYYGRVKMPDFFDTIKI